MRRRARSKTWTDSNGNIRRVPSPSRRPRYSQFDDCAELREYVFDRDGGQCRFCGDRQGLVVDHIVSLRNGGTNHPQNLQTLCRDCNVRKGSLIDKPNPFEHRHMVSGWWATWDDGDEIHFRGILPDRNAKISLPRNHAETMIHALGALVLGRFAGDAPEIGAEGSEYPDIL